MKLLLTVLLGVGFLGAAAQPGCPNPFDDNAEFGRYHFTAGAGITQLKGTIKENEKLGQAIFGRIDYQIIKGLYVGVEGQYGALKAAAADNKQYVRNNYLAAGVNFTIHPLEMVLDNYFSNNIIQQGINSLYVGAGAKAVRNKYDLEHSKGLEVANYTDANGTWMFPSFNIGSAVPITRKGLKKRGYWSVVGNAQFNQGSNENLDGFHARQEYIQTDGSVGHRLAKGQRDNYDFYSLALRYSF